MVSAKCCPTCVTSTSLRARFDIVGLAHSEEIIFPCTIGKLAYCRIGKSSKPILLDYVRRHMKSMLCFMCELLFLVAHAEDVPYPEHIAHQTRAAKAAAVEAGRRKQLEAFFSAALGL